LAGRIGELNLDKLKYALVGCGRISKKHIEALASNNNLFLPVACVDPVISRAQKNAQEISNLFSGIKVKSYDSYEKMISENSIDMAAIASESGKHPQIACSLLKNNIHVIVEKPMALSTADCDAIIETAKQHKRKVGVCYQNRFNLPIMKLKKAVDERKFGRIHNGQISIRWNRNEEYYRQADWRCTWELDGGALMNQCSHGIDLLQWILGGKVKSVYGVLRKFSSPREAEDFGSAIIEFDEGIVGIIEASVNVYPKNLEEKLSIFGDKGTAVIGGLAVNHLETWNFEDEKYSEERIDPPNVYGFGHISLYKDFYEAIRDDREPHITAEEGKKSVEIILAVYNSMLTGKRIDFPVEFSTVEMKGLNLKKV
jgi:UDP-N-acetyl-2-amino-2-deoxyglucuronate dehydrogenase